MRWSVRTRAKLLTSWAREEKMRERKGEGHNAFQQHVVSDLTFSRYALPPKSPISHQCHRLWTSSSTHKLLVDIKIQTFKSHNMSSTSLLQRF